MRYHFALTVGLALLSSAAFAQLPGTPTGRADDETAVTQRAADTNVPSKFQEASADLVDAYKAYQSGHYADAADRLQAIVKKSPTNVQAQELLAACDMKLNRTSDALQHMQAYLQLKPDDLSARENLAFLYLQSNRPADAVPQFQTILAKTPKDAQAEYGLAVALQSSGQNAQATDAFSKTTELDPKNADAWLYLGISYTQAGNFAKAIPALKQAITLKTSDPYDAHLALAHSEASGGNNADALQDFAAASQLKPQEFDPLFNQAVLQQQAGDTAKAEDNYRKVLALKPTDPNQLKPTQTNLGLLLAKDGDPATALPVLTQAAQSDPSNVDIQAALGLMYLKKGQKEDAKAAYQKALALNPNRADAKAGLADASK